MAYTVWFKGKLLGESELAHARIFPKARMGDFAATTEGEPIIAAMTDVSTSVITLGRVLDSKAGQKLAPTDVESLTEYADWMSAMRVREAIDLELRGPDGKLIPTESIEIRDTEVMVKIGDEAAEEDDAELTPEQQEAVDEMIRELEEASAEAEKDAAWRPEEESTFPRYQIQVMLEDEWSVP